VALSAQRLETLLRQMRGRRLAIVGDVILDRYLVGDSERISPEAPVPVVRVTGERVAPGGAANVASNVAALGGEPLLVGALGGDRAAEALRQELATHGIADRWLYSLAGRPTTTKTRVIARGQQVVRIDEEDDAVIDAEATRRLGESAAEVIALADALILEDYDKGVLSPGLIRTAIAAAADRGLPIVVDPKHRGFFCYQGASVLKPNRRELAEALGAGADLTRPEQFSALMARLGVRHLLVTLGSEGMLLVDRDGGTERIPSQAREVYDVSGAGDTVTAWVAAALAAGAPVLEAATVANLAAGVEVGKAGVSTVSPEEILAAGTATA
jgi:D-beta-D-heptose 7-phosphate kinase/D-beta-D-heptose 1-phosphate adenosyltransferase